MAGSAVGAASSGSEDAMVVDMPKNLCAAVLCHRPAHHHEYVILELSWLGQSTNKSHRVKLGFDGLFYVDNIGLSGGLALLWRKNCTASLLSYSRNHIDVKVTVPASNAWRMTCFYGFPERSKRRESWELLRSLTEGLLRGFGETVDACGLAQLPMKGYRFTWERGRGTDGWIEERLDKVLVTDSWFTLQSGAAVENILMRSSDHSALYLSMHDTSRRGLGGRRSFKFEMAWLLDEGCREVVETAWQAGRSDGFLGCLKVCGDKLMAWGGDHFHRFGEQIKQLRVSQMSLRGRRDLASLAEFQCVEGELARLEAQEDIFWRQRAKQHWLKGADANTHFYHSRMDEIKTALFSMFPNKDPGPDGMNPGFYQHYWDVVGGDVSAFVIDCLNSCTFPEGLNDTNVVLIPKKSVPESVSDLRPIALCNVVYKIMAKVLANRMKHLLGNIISESQSAFIPGRLITDNILVAAEVGHYLNRKQNGLVGWGALKLDMPKAYDRMEWSFLRRMLHALGFAERWINLIMLCVTTVSYNFMINGVNSEHVLPTRELRQGDPLSPYLFIICADGLSLFLQKVEREGLIHGCRVARGAPSISHLFFADDSLLFFKANSQEAGVIKHCLEVYENLSGQSVNFHKSSVCFSRNTSEDQRHEVAQVLGVVQAPNFGKYLGLPAFVGRNRRTAFSYIEDKIRQRIGSWNKKLLSQAGKEILLKTVAQAMPTFSMSVFLLPHSTCLSIQRVMNSYWWDSGVDRRIHWKAWDRLCVPKKFGGLGFKDLRAFNLAMLGKQVWRLLIKPQSLVARVYKARYFPRTSFIDATLGSCPSYCWRSIMAAHDMVCGGVRRRIGDGKTTLIWGHPWLPDDPTPMIQTPICCNEWLTGFRVD
ncbi:uncharacterized protein LOC116024038 [Ipomoea triloba]|uniref:uncharacterized protein LOC116024038 n=1 Tax=Ipomoea triloba TaxID=35885 RepID=UPI00125D23E7|nr:uncharacterized protein LOC116024038 [Ipomoea triloba]